MNINYRFLRHRPITLFVFCCIIVSQPTIADQSYVPVYHPTLEISRALGHIKIDGRLDDSGWQAAAKANNFAEHQPGDQVKPPVETKVFLTYDANYLYVAFICNDDPGTIRASKCDRERIFADDNVALLLDTYGDAAWAYELFVNPYGIQGDGLWSRSGGEDMTYDLIFKSAGRITESGYQVEMAVPFSSLRFPDKEEQVWKVDFWRNRPRESQGQYSWAAYDRDDPCWPCQWGEITGIRNVHPGRGVEIMPTLVGYQTGELDDRDKFKNEDPDGQFAINTKYSITSTIVAEATYNPDFSQIESDVAQIDVNTTFALFYPERRPFFQEGSDLFRSWIPLIYTRSINDPDFAGKLTARINRTSIAYLVAQDEHSPFILPQEEGSAFLLGGKSISNIIRAKRELGDDTHIGMLVTDRRIDGGGSGTVLNVDGQVKFSKHIRVQWQGLATHTEEPDDEELSAEIQDWIDWGVIKPSFDNGNYTSVFDGESYWGYGWLINLEQRSRHWRMDFNFTRRTPTYRADNGFEPKNDQQLGDASIGYMFYPNGDIFEWINPHGNIGSRWNFDGAKKDEWLWLNMSTKLKIAQANFHSQYMRSAESFGGIQFDDIWNVHQCMHLNPSDLISFGGSIDYGHRIARRYLRMGKEYFISGWVDLKPVDRVLLENWFYYNKSNDLSTNEQLFEGFIYRTRLNYQFTRQLSLRWVVQYDDFNEEWEIAPLLTYRLSPFSVFYIGSTYSYDNFDDPNNDRYDNSTRLCSRQYFVKLQYLFQI